MWRGIFDWSDEAPAWREACTPFRERYGSSVPKFSSKSDAIAFIKKHCTAPSNPYDPSLTHVFSMMFTWYQITDHLLPKIFEYRLRFGTSASDDMTPRYPLRYTGGGGLAPRRELEVWPPGSPTEPPDDDLPRHDWMLPQKVPDVPPPGASESTVFYGLEANRYLREAPLEGEAGEYVFEGEGLDVKKVREGLRQRLDLPFHREISDESVLNTFKYLFFHMRCGIYVMIRGNRLRIFAPFVNSEYHNAWKGALEVQGGDVQEYARTKLDYYPHEGEYIKDMRQWWANGNIICNVASPNHWGDQFLTPIKDMLETLCATRCVPDVEFFVNKRDYPHLKYNPASQAPVEPYGFIFNRDDRTPDDDVDLDPAHSYASYAPILSFYCSSRFADLPVLPSEDWEAATGFVYVNSFKHRIEESGDVALDGGPRDLFTETNLRKFECRWEDKIDVAFFRGSASGGGVTPDTNQRIRISLLSAEWKTDPVKGGNWYGSKHIENPAFPGDDPVYPYLDAALTAWNGRDKKIHLEPMTFLRPRELREQGVSAGRENFTPIFDQSKFKYVVYVEGHCAACRYAFMMRLGSVIIKVDSRCVADEMWYFPLLRPYYDHVPVKEDLSDLADQIAWCRAHDDQCRAIAANAQRLWDRFCCRDGALDYMQMLLNEVALNWRSTPAWCKSTFEVGVAKPPSAAVLDPKAPKARDPAEVKDGEEESFDWSRARDWCCKRDEVLCSFCQDEFDHYDGIRRAQQESEKRSKSSAANQRKLYAERKKRRLAKAREEQQGRT